MVYDVAIIGGGPAGSTVACCLRKYNSQLNVVILEREQFPRDHVGESQLPPISRILDEIGCWDKVEAAGFPIKIGATYRWGKSPEPWDFEFIPRELFKDEPRPAKYEGQRRFTAFQVDRSTYDLILLEQAGDMGCEVRQSTKVSKVLHQGDRVEALVLASGEQLKARHYVDASGHAGILRRAMGVETETPTSLQNIAIWDYWQNAEWAEQIGTGGTMVQVLSIGYGWLWFIPMGPTRTSIGFVTSASYYKAAKLGPDQLYLQAILEEPRVRNLTKNARREEKIQTTTDWSFIAKRMYGENWLLAGESGGFADPILAAGLSLAHKAAQEAAYTLLEIERGAEDPKWLLAEFERGQARRLRNHIRFADYWYSTNALFEDLKDYTAKIAADNGLDLTPDKAWQWLAQGGFIDEELTIGLAGYGLEQVKHLGEHLTTVKTEEYLDRCNVFHLKLDGATLTQRAKYASGAVSRCPCYTRGNRVLPVLGVIDLVVTLLKRNSTRPHIAADLRQVAQTYKDNPAFVNYVLAPFKQTLEAMILDGWVEALEDPKVALSWLPGNADCLAWLNATP